MQCVSGNVDVDAKNTEIFLEGKSPKESKRHFILDSRATLFVFDSPESVLRVTFYDDDMSSFLLKILCTEVGLP
jgi:hypothetical protein